MLVNCLEGFQPLHSLAKRTIYFITLVLSFLFCKMGFGPRTHLAELL